MPEPRRSPRRSPIRETQEFRDSPRALPAPRTRQKLSLLVFQCLILGAEAQRFEFKYFPYRHSHEHSDSQGAEVSVRDPFFLLFVRSGASPLRPDRRPVSATRSARQGRPAGPPRQRRRDLAGGEPGDRLLRGGHRRPIDVIRARTLFNCGARHPRNSHTVAGLAGSPRIPHARGHGFGRRDHTFGRLLSAGDVSRFACPDPTRLIRPRGWLQER